ncbi:sushi domain-containing protein 6 isoform X2 [Esox lucius]|uniref:sushi domain-containing protein 6 isoform X2 n=1 Tax=Esox lucius TaxID=8010 RepID=UPI0014768A8D|nr:sushi domain-containing protein 6 isoform X2 [Esox lucius]
MCNGMLDSMSNVFGLPTSSDKQSLSLLFFLTVLATGQGSGCVRPFMVQNSWVNLTETNRGSFPVGTVLQYSCDPGYLADGPTIITCSSLGHWTSDPPRCIRSDVCRPPSEPLNGGYTCHPSPCHRLGQGTVIEYFCDEGYILKGDYKYKYLTCQDGEWDGPMQISCVNQGCLRPFMVQHASVNLTETSRGFFHVGAVLQYSCDPGFVQDGPNIVTCTPLGRWSSDPPGCVRSNVCLPPFEPENGGYTCHPSPCHSLSHRTVIEYFCDEGYILKGDYKYLTCQDGEWDGPMQISCLLDQVRDPAPPLGIPTLSIVASTASSVALILLLVVLFVLLQPKLKSFNHSRREQGVSGQPVSIMVEGVQVALPSYEEAVCGGGSLSLSSEARVQIVLSEGQQASGTTEPLIAPVGLSRPSTLSQLSEMAVAGSVLPTSPTSPSSGWDPEQAAAAAPSRSQRRDSTRGGQYSLPLHDPETDYSDDMPLLKEA